MTIDKFLPYGRQSIDAFDITDLSEAAASDWITRGPKVEAFEAAVADYCGARYAVAFCNGTAALEAAYFAAEVGPFDRVVSPANTFVGSIVGALKAKSDVVFVDINRSHGSLDLEALQPNVVFRSTRGKLIVTPVHFAGIALDMHRLRAMVKNPSSMIIEDAAHALGSYYPTGEKVGSCVFSDMTAFSFHPVKTVTTGEGGMVTTNDPKLAERLRIFRNNGIVREEGGDPWCYSVTAVTGNYNMTDIQAALGISQLSKLDGFVAQRRALVQRYRERLAGTSWLRLFDERYDAHTCYHLFVVQIDFEQLHTDRRTLMEALRAAGIGTQVHYIPLYKHPVCFIDPITALECFEETEGYYESALSLPLYADLTEADVDYVCETLLGMESLAIQP